MNLHENNDNDNDNIYMNDTNMDLIVDMFGDTLVYDDKLENDKDEQYYIGKAENIMKQLNKKNYYIFLMTLLKNYNTLNKKEKEEIIKLLDIKPVEKIIEKKIYINNNSKKQKQKPKLNNNLDDY